MRTKVRTYDDPMRVNLYIGNRDRGTWERATQHAKKVGISFSRLAVIALEDYLRRDTARTARHTKRNAA